MKATLRLFTFLLLIAGTLSCSHRYYTNSLFEQQTKNHHVVAILPAEMIFTGNQPKELSADDIKQIEETESLSFQQALYNSILRYANTSKYFTTVNIQDIGTTLSLLKKDSISIRDSWQKDDRELCRILNVDAVVRMRIRKQRYMSDMASYGIGVAKQVIFNSGIGAKIPVPNMVNKTNDIYASCSLLSNNYALWNDSYKASINYNGDATQVIENITDDFGRNFPYKKTYKQQRREQRG
ncbi:MAG TPA: hypothetical protein VFS36_00290 [Chitinophagaceae bacterium]|jgi:hypothetical protein|nr:hypothetical protein [Chitinophagaceae bacterium]